MPDSAAVSAAAKDCWYGVQDPKKRKQIQDRLAQRARRKRLAAAKGGDGTRVIRSQKTRCTLSNGVRLSNTGNSSSTDEAYSAIRLANRNLLENMPGDREICEPPSRTREHTVISALFETGAILGIACGSSFPSKSKATGPEIPASLQPTILQMSTVHWQWIDRLPFPDVRDEIILQSGNIDEENFLWDFFNMETFKLKQGSKAWDPTAFTICPGFQAKWGFLFPCFSRDGR